MIDRQHGKTLIECDSCNEVFEGDQGDEFAVVWAAAKRDGWRTRKIANEWLHGCPKCGVPA
jgi:rubredoxin